MLSQWECGRDELGELMRESESGDDIGETASRDGWMTTKFLMMLCSVCNLLQTNDLNNGSMMRADVMRMEMHDLISRTRWCDREIYEDPYHEKLISQRARRDGMMSARTKDFIFMGRGSCRFAASKCCPPTAFRMEMRERSRSRSGCRRSDLAFWRVLLVLSQSRSSTSYPNHRMLWVRG